MPRTGDHLRDALIVAGAILMAATLYLVFFYVPTDANLGVSQRIFYFHVPIAILSLLSVVVVAVASASASLRQGREVRRRGLRIGGGGIRLLHHSHRDRSDLGQASMGRVVDVGPEADAHARALVHLRKPT